jgi:hypothetical protein
VGVTAAVTVRIDEVVLDGIDEQAVTAELVQAEVARALARRPVERATEVATEVGRAVEGIVRQ